MGNESSPTNTNRSGSLLRKLRISFSAGCAILCLLLIALWVRSYWWTDQIVCKLSSTAYVGIGVLPGALGVGFSKDSNVTPWTQNTFPTEAWLSHDKKYSRIWGGFIFELQATVIPIWLIGLSLMSLGAIAWLPWRFSLRTLLIAMTVIALALGLLAISN